MNKLIKDLEDIRGRNKDMIIDSRLGMILHDLKTEELVRSKDQVSKHTPHTPPLPACRYCATEVSHD